MPTLNQEQITGLKAAEERIAKGIGKAEDIATDQENLNYAVSKLGYKPTTFNPSAMKLGEVLESTPTSATSLGATVATAGKTAFEQGTGIEGYDQALAAEGEKKTTGMDWANAMIQETFKEATPITAPTFEAEKTRLEESKNSRLAALDAKYAVDLATVRQQNKNVGNSLKSRLMKLGVNPSDTAWSNAEAGQLERDRAAEAKLSSEYESNKAAIESDIDAKISNIAMNEATMNFNAQVQNVQNKLQTQAQGINLYQIFSQRDQSEKDREQSAYNNLLQYQGTMAGLQQKQQEAIAKNFIENAQAGLYNISDKTTLEMLTKLEKESPYLTGLTQVASAGLVDRLDKKAVEAANLEKTKAETQKIGWDIKNIQSEIAKRAKAGSGTGSKENKKLEILNRYAGYIDQQLHTTTDENGNMMSTKKVNPNGLSVSDYNKARQSAVLEGISGADFDEAFSSAVSAEQRYTPSAATDTGSYIDQVTGKVISIKSPY